jgi:beta-galactosidase
MLGTAGMVAASGSTAAPRRSRTRERILLDTGWRFRKGDDPAYAGRLDYDVRPELKRSEDGKAADARPEAAERQAAAGDVLKPWILPTANRFIADLAARHQRPAGDPGGDHPFVQPGHDDTSWRAVTVPHDWAIEGPWLTEGPFGGMGRLPSWGIGWYRRRLDIARSDAGRSIFLELDGAMSYATVWLNGRLVGGWPYGYASWQLDLTPFVIPGAVNQLAIRLDNPPESARWYPGGGLYRNVWLTKVDPVHVAQWGTRLRMVDLESEATLLRTTTGPAGKEAALCILDVTVDNDGLAAADVDVETDIFLLDASGRRQGAPVGRFSPSRKTIPGGASATSPPRPESSTPVSGARRRARLPTSISP